MPSDQKPGEIAGPEVLFITIQRLYSVVLAAAGMMGSVPSSSTQGVIRNRSTTPTANACILSLNAV